MNKEQQNFESREKYWKELDIIAKAERLRQEVKGLRSSLDDIRSAFSFMQDHRHAEDGKITVDIDTVLNRPMSMDRRSHEDKDDEAYI